jgi:hypothetical protein
VIGTQMFATHGSAMACLARAMDEKTVEDVAQAALRRAERLLAVYARQSDAMLRARGARRLAGSGKAERDGAGALAYDAPPWMMLLAPEARAWIEAQIAEARAGTVAPEPARLAAAAQPQALSYQPSPVGGLPPQEDENGDGV